MKRYMVLEERELSLLIPKDNEKEVPLGLEDIEVKSISHIEELMEIVFEK